MAERILDDLALPPPGRRSGAGSASILPYLLQSLAARPTVPAAAPVQPRPRPGIAPTAGRARISRSS
ncbi:MAG: hypothetical protein ACYC0T_06165 [Ramlibacter sp.]